MNKHPTVVPKPCSRMFRESSTLVLNARAYSCAMGDMSLDEATRMVYDSGLNTMVKLADARNKHMQGCVNGHLIDCAMLRIMYQNARGDNHFLQVEIGRQMQRAWSAVRSGDICSCCGH